MQPDPGRLACTLSHEIGLPFEGRLKTSDERQRTLEFVPAGHSDRYTFSIIATLRFRRLELEFLPGNYAADLLQSMREAGDHAKELFNILLDECRTKGATVQVSVNGAPEDETSTAFWEQDWRRFRVGLKRPNLEIGDTDESDVEIMVPWLLRFTAAVTSLLPLEDAAEDEIPNEDGLPEGAVTRVEVNRYERDRRNRAAALAIHGSDCASCGMSFADTYGDIAAGFIEVHHITPVSKMTPGYRVNPKTDLIPLCPNCHSVAHRRKPPLTVDEIKEVLG